jgi:hypothetical protein
MERILVFIIILGKRRASLAQVRTGVFRGMIEVVDIREHEIEKSSKREEIMEYQG